MMNKRIQILGVLVGLLAAITANGFAQSRHVTASNLGLGGGGTAYLDSYHSNFVNPANLMLNRKTKPRFSIGLIGGFSTTAGGSLLNTTVYNDYFTRGLTVTGDLADEALDKWFGPNDANLRDIGIQLDIIPFGTAYRGDNWAASAAVRTRALVHTELSRGLAELGMHGLDGAVFADPRAVDFNLEAMTVAELSVGYAMKILAIPNLFGVFRNVNLYAGAAPKMLVGTHLSRMAFQSTLQIVEGTDGYIEELRHDFNYTFETTGKLSEQLTNYYNDRQNMAQEPDIGDYIDPRAEDLYELKASGYGVDLGATLEMEFDMPILGSLSRGPELLQIGASLTDLGSITFDDEVGRFTADGEIVWEGFEDDPERIDNEFDGNAGDYYEHVLVDSIGSDIYGGFVPGQADAITRGLPSMLNFGARLTMRHLSLSVDLGKGFVERGVNSERVSFAAGIEYRLFGFMPFRGGLHTGGLASTTYTAGWGLEFRNFEFSVAAAAVRRSLNHGSYASAAWSGLVFRF